MTPTPPRVETPREPTMTESDAEWVNAEITECGDVDESAMFSRILATYYALASSREEVERLTEVNQSVAVCAKHTEDILGGAGLKNSCYVCAYDELTEALAQATGDSERDKRYLGEMRAFVGEMAAQVKLGHPSFCVGIHIGGEEEWVSWYDAIRRLASLDAARTPSTETTEHE
jgi:hypothetical protein